MTGTSIYTEYVAVRNLLLTLLRQAFRIVRCLYHPTLDSESPGIWRDNDLVIAYIVNFSYLFRTIGKRILQNPLCWLIQREMIKNTMKSAF